MSSNPVYVGHVSLEEVSDQVQVLKGRVNGICQHLFGDPNWTSTSTGTGTGTGTSTSTGTGTGTGTGTSTGTGTQSGSGGTTSTGTSSGSTGTQSGSQSGTSSGTGTSTGTQSGSQSGTSGGTGTTQGGGTSQGTQGTDTQSGSGGTGTQGTYIDRTLTLSSTLINVDVPKRQTTLNVYGYVVINAGVITGANIVFGADFYPNGRAEQNTITRRGWIRNDGWVGIQAFVRNNGTYEIPSGNYQTPQPYITLAIIPNDVPGAHRIELTLTNPNPWCNDADFVRLLPTIKF